MEIVPTQITGDQWQAMVDDLERILKGLSMELIRKNTGVGEYFHQAIPTVLLYRFMVIQKRFGTVMAALSDLLNKVNCRIKKEYSMVIIEL